MLKPHKLQLVQVTRHIGETSFLAAIVDGVGREWVVVLRELQVLRRRWALYLGWWWRRLDYGLRWRWRRSWVTGSLREVAVGLKENLEFPVNSFLILPWGQEGAVRHWIRRSVFPNPPRLWKPSSRRTCGCS
jgi:hypothetical protein